MTISSGLFACQCISNDSIVNEYNDASIVFEGKVVKIDTVFSSDTLHDVISSKNSKPHIEVFIRKYLAVRFAVTRLFKGDSQSIMTITVMTKAAGSACGFDFMQNLNYVVYGYTDQFNLVDSSDVFAKRRKKKIKTLTVTRYSTSSCTRTTPWIEGEISELRSNKLIE